jgi:hypothetical protein
MREIEPDSGVSDPTRSDCVRSFTFNGDVARERGGALNYAMTYFRRAALCSG